jgi:serine/threonine protein kinase
MARNSQITRVRICGVGVTERIRGLTLLFPAARVDSPVEFGPYLLTEQVGQGGMAVVYKAMRRGPGGFAKTVVVKAMLPTLSAQREFVAMFSAEARLMAALTHPNIVQVQDFGVVDNIPYLVMEYLPGRNVSQLRAQLAATRARLPVGAALTIVRELCHGLAFAHQFVDEEGRRRRVIHRDVSPSNVMVCRDGSVKLLDFGVAKIVGELELDVTQSLKGKYAYMAPEQVEHQPIDCRVDVFAAGVILHELLTGKRLFAANSELETLQRVAAAQVVAPSIDNRDVPRALDAIVKKALARAPGDRYATGAELAEALETLDALAWPRKRLAAFMRDLFAHEWSITCEVCGKAVLPATECEECGTEAPDSSTAIAIEPAKVDPKTDRNVFADDPMPRLPLTGSEPLPLPPPPLTPVPRRAPKVLPNEAAQRRLQVVRTPIPPPLAPRDATTTTTTTSAETTANDDVPKAALTTGPLPPLEAERSGVAPVEPSLFARAGEIEAPAAVLDPCVPRLFIVPSPEPTPLPAEIEDASGPAAVLAAPRPSRPVPLRVVRPSSITAHVDRRSSLPLYVVGGAAVAAIMFALVTLLTRPSENFAPPPPEPRIVTAPPVVVTPTRAQHSPPPSAHAPRVESHAAISPPTSHVDSSRLDSSRMDSSRVDASRMDSSRVAMPPQARPVVRHKIARAPKPAPVDERSVKEGRLVDPFAGAE